MREWPAQVAGTARVLFVVNEDWYFWSHRRELALAAQSEGYEVWLAAHFSSHRPRIEALGIRCVPLPIARGLSAPFQDLNVMLQLAALIRHQRPSIVHAVALKSILLCTVAARLSRDTIFCLAATGLGHLFTEHSLRNRLLRKLIVPLLSRLARHPRGLFIVQNQDDLQTLLRLGVGSANDFVQIRGSGVDIERFVPSPLPRDAVPLVLMPARVLKDKGVLEFAEAARLLAAQGIACRCVLVGGLDSGNPSALSHTELMALCAESNLTWWDHRDDLPTLLREATLVCLPSYREGLPKALLEAAACGRPMVATDVPGCREICVDRITGRLVPAQDGRALAMAIVEMLDDPDSLTCMGQAARALVEQEFSSAVINRQTLDVYAQLRAATP